MAQCPNCGRKLHLKDWRPECPGCGVNLNYFKSNEKLLEESEKVEIAHAKSQPKVDRAKAATIGTNIGRIRMALFLIPIAALFLPLFSITVGGNKTNYNALGIYNVFNAIDTGKITDIISPVVIAAVLLVIPAVCCIVFTVLQVTAGTKRGLRKNVILSSISLVLVIASLVCMFVFTKSPATDYSEIILNEAQNAASNKGQSEVDSALLKIQALYNENSVDTEILKRALKNGKAVLKSKVDRGYTDEEVTALKEAVSNAKTVLENKEATVSEVRDAASAVNNAVNTYSKLRKILDESNTDITLSENHELSDELYNQLCKITDETVIYLQVAVDSAKKINNDNGLYSEKSFGNLQSVIEEAQGYIDTLNKGELIVDPIDDDASGEKTDKEIADETGEKIASVFSNLNGRVSGLVDVSVINPYIEKLNNDLESGNFQSDVKASVGIGMFLFMLLFVIQLVYNIVIFKKGFEVKYTTCLIGGIPSDEYFALVEQGFTKDQIHRKMLVALAELQDEAEKNIREEETV